MLLDVILLFVNPVLELLIESVVVVVGRDGDSDTIGRCLTAANDEESTI